MTVTFMDAREAKAELDRLYEKREAELNAGNHYDAGQTWAEFQKVACANWRAISEAIKL